MHCYSVLTSLVNDITKFQPIFTFFINCQSLEVIAQCIRSINTMSGTRSFVIAVAFDMEHYPQVKNALGGDNKEMCCMYSAGTRKNGNRDP